MSLKMECHSKWKAIYNEKSPKMNVTQNGMSLKNGISPKMECHSKCNSTQMESYSKLNVTQNGMPLKTEYH